MNFDITTARTYLVLANISAQQSRNCCLLILNQLMDLMIFSDCFKRDKDDATLKYKLIMLALYAPAGDPFKMKQ